MTLSQRFGASATVGLVAVGLITTAVPAVPTVPTAKLAADVLIIAACLSMIADVALPLGSMEAEQ